MRRRIPWSLLFGVGLGLWMFRQARRRRPGLQARRRARRPREPEVVRLHGPTPVEAGLERPVASGDPTPIPGRTIRGATRPRPAPGPEPAQFEPVAADAPEERDPAAEPRPVDPDVPAGTPVPPAVRRHRE